MVAQFQGLHKDYKKGELYYKFVCKKGDESERKTFLQARKMKQRNEAGPDRKRLQSKKKLPGAKKELKVEQKMGGKFIATKKQFASLENWGESKRGPVDQSKVVTEVEQETVRNSSETPIPACLQALKPWCGKGIPRCATDAKGTIAPRPLVTKLSQ